MARAIIVLEWDGGENVDSQDHLSRVAQEIAGSFIAPFDPANKGMKARVFCVDDNFEMIPGTLEPILTRDGAMPHWFIPA